MVAEPEKGAEGSRGHRPLPELAVPENDVMRFGAPGSRWPLSSTMIVVRKPGGREMMTSFTRWLAATSQLQSLDGGQNAELYCWQLSEEDILHVACRGDERDR